MQIKLHKNIQRCAMVPQRLKARPDITERWFDVDTTRIEPNRYYVIGDDGNAFIVNDLFVSEIRDDVRCNAIQCKYCAALFCGKTVQEAESAYEAHCDAAEKQCCPEDGPFVNCFYRLPKLFSYRLEKDYELDCYRLYNQRKTIMFLFDPVHDKCWATTNCFSGLMRFKGTAYGVDRRLAGKVKEIMHELYGMKK